MQVSGAYIAVVLIWSTTPLAIHLSNSSLSFVSAIAARMLLAFVVCFIALKLRRERLFQSRRDILMYLASGVGLFPNMLLVYWAAQYIPSGLMSVIMGIYPFFVGLFSMWILRESPFNLPKVLALCFAVTGLAVINHEQFSLGADSFKGVMAMVFACVLWGLSTVLVKKLGASVSPLRQGTGSIAIALPFFLIAWVWLDGEIPQQIDQKSFWGITYLVLMGSLVGHTLWFYVLRECTVFSVSLVTLMTPVLALTWGILFLNEHFSAATLLGAVMIVFSLMLYQGILPVLWRKVSAWRARKRVAEPVAVPSPGSVR